MAGRYFTPQTLSFLRKLASHNHRDWFEQNRHVYEEAVRQPALQFIADIADDLALLSPHFLAQPKKVGGSLMRIYRDVRFARDKKPFKTNIGIQFRHEMGRDVHAPGFYLHIEPGHCFVGAGIWRPDPTALGKVRDAVAEQSKKWLSVINDRTFSKVYTLSGETLSRPPRGYVKDHPLIADIKRKDFIAIAELDEASVLGPGLQKQVLKQFKVADGFMQFLCDALNLLY